MEVLIDLETLPKMNRLLGIVGGKVLLKEGHESYVRLIVEKASD